MGKADAAYRRLFEHPAMVRDLMVCVLSARVLASLDWDCAKSVPTNHVSDRLKTRSGDLVWLIPYRQVPDDPSLPRSLCILLLLEHQSESDATMPLRTAVYTGLSYQSLLRSKEVDLPLPPVLPVVLYSGDTPWRAPLEMAGLTAGMPDDLRPYQLQMRYLLVEERLLLQVSGVPDQNLAALMFRLGASREIEQWQALVHTLVQATQGPEFRELNRSMTAWLLLMAQSNAALDTPLPAVNTLEELTMMISEKPGVWAQQWKREGQADLLLRQIERRFGPIPDEVTQRVHAANESQLMLWSLNFVDATILDDVFRD